MNVIFLYEYIIAVVYAFCIVYIHSSVDGYRLIPFPGYCGYCSDNMDVQVCPWYAYLESFGCVSKPGRAEPYGSSISVLRKFNPNFCNRHSQ